MTEFDPLQWVSSLQRSLKEYIEDEINNAVTDGALPTPNPIGLQAFDVILDFPVSAEGARSADFPKTIIHLEIDDIENRKLGFGTDIVQAEYVEGDVDTPATLVEKEAMGHIVNFDVGVWASDLSGGSSSRLLAYEILERIFGGNLAREKCATATGGVEILTFDGGRFVPDVINDIRVFRIVDCTLRVRVYSRKDSGDLIVADEITQDPHLTIDNPPVAVS